MHGSRFSLSAKPNLGLVVSRDLLSLGLSALYGSAPVLFASWETLGRDSP